ncbi:multiple inositol polyphosphate phosphatase 1b isoform X2 [Scomber japonicus]|uniref:multiple inositol polyphosphate phosphatase 1b isoform X2 n=1 Tax=Scomber japonicus TaxID=13676 RepID=UPI0023058323|nr:multiple inositol polyphosphate phosphatase 1b isoform X2 [Scomber japonicus]
MKTNSCLYQRTGMFPVCVSGTGALTAAVCLLLCRLSSSSPPAPVPLIASYFGTKTRYEEVNPHLLLDPLSVNRSVLKPPDTERCSPVHITAVIRHGSRFPTVKNIRRIQQLSDLLREASGGSGVSGVAEGSGDWLQDIQSRWVTWYTEDMDEVQYTHQLDDQLMRFFEHCRGYVDGVEKNRTALAEVEKFKHGEEMEGVRKRMAERLGLPHHRLTPDLVEAAFFLCSYELSIKSLHSPWCFLFDQKDAQVLEYKSDLKQYWKRSHGHVINGLSSCPLFHHVFRTLDKAGRPRRSSDAPPDPASVLIGHAETLLPFLSLLGLHKDETPPTAANYQSQHGRSFRTSRIVPYAANVVLVLYDCERGARLQLLVNESPVRFPPLPDEDAPLYRDVRAAYRPLLDGCSEHRGCEGRHTEL